VFTDVSVKPRLKLVPMNVVFVLFGVESCLNCENIALVEGFPIVPLDAMHPLIHAELAGITFLEPSGKLIVRFAYGALANAECQIKILAFIG